MLLSAGIERAAGVIACVDSDAENIFIGAAASAGCVRTCASLRGRRARTWSRSRCVPAPTEAISL